MTGAERCDDCERRGDLIQGVGTAVLVAAFIGFSYALYRHLSKPLDFDALLDAAERRELLRQAAAGEAPPEA